MDLLLAFGVALIVGVALSGLARRSILSLAVLFLVAGFVAGDAVLGFGDPADRHEVVSVIAQAALFVVLFTDGLHLSLRQLWRHRHLPGRALLVGAPISFGVILVAAHVVVGLPWASAFLVAAVLTPTDPVFASALIRREEVPRRLRELLNIESGLNDGLALPIVFTALAILGHRHVDALGLALEIAGGLALGVAVPWVVCHAVHPSWLNPAERFRVLEPVATAIMLFAVAERTGANPYLAAFVGGVTMRSVDEELVTGNFAPVGDALSQFLKLAATFVFGAALTFAVFTRVPASTYALAVIVLLVARPVGVAIAFIGTDLDLRERATAAWFGPKGFSSVVYGLIVLGSGLGGNRVLFEIIAVVVVISMVAHSSSDVAVARSFVQAEERPAAR